MASSTGSSSVSQGGTVSTGTEHLLLQDAGVVGQVSDDGELVEEALTVDALTARSPRGLPVVPATDLAAGHVSQS
jgi:hypothetical protein